MAREHARLATKIRLKLSSCTHSHFIKQLMNAFEKSPRENNLNQETSNLLIRRLKNYTGFSRQQFTQKQELNFGLHAAIGKQIEGEKQPPCPDERTQN
jgi:hypothetical protein